LPEPSGGAKAKLKAACAACSVRSGSKVELGNVRRKMHDSTDLRGPCSYPAAHSSDTVEMTATTEHWE
jgi:hypothetical protein